MIIADHVRQPVRGEEHVLGAAQADALGAERARLLGVARNVGVGAHLEPAAADRAQRHEGAELAGHLGRDRRRLAEDHPPGRAVERDPVALLTTVASPTRNRRADVSTRTSPAPQTHGVAHAARDHRGVRRQASGRGEDALGGVHAVDVVGRGLLAHQDHASSAARSAATVGVEHRASHRRTRRGGETPGDHRRASPWGRGAGGAADRAWPARRRITASSRVISPSFTISTAIRTAAWRGALAGPRLEQVEACSPGS